MQRTNCQNNNSRDTLFQQFEAFQMQLILDLQIRKIANTKACSHIVLHYLDHDSTK